MHNSIVLIVVFNQWLFIQISDVDTAESFLSQVINHNRPRVILFSPHRNPSVRYKLAAFSHQKTADCAFVSTHQSWLNKQLLSRFKIQPGDKELLVFKEDSGSEPSMYLEVRKCKSYSLKVPCTCAQCIYYANSIVKSRFV